jgi:secreted PhoX family phosphatase
MENADNLTVTPWGDLIICEDGPEEEFLIGITPEGHIYRFARNAGNMSELAGATFSPDGTTLFVNIQSPGITLAITGPWHEIRQRPLA